MRLSVLKLVNMDSNEFNKLSFDEAVKYYEYGRKKANERLRKLEKENLDFASAAYRRVMEYYNPQYTLLGDRNKRKKLNNKMENKIEFEDVKYMPKDVGKLKSNLARVISFLKAESSTVEGQRRIEAKLRKEFVKNFKIDNLSREELSEFWEFYDKLSYIPGFQALKNKNKVKYQTLQETAAKVYLASGSFKTFSNRMEKLIEDMEQGIEFNIDDIVEKYAKRSRRLDRIH